MRKLAIVSVSMLLLTSVVFTRADDGSSGTLFLEVAYPRPVVLEACPIVISVSLRNAGTKAVDSVFDLTRQAELSEATHMSLEDADGRLYRLHFQAGPQVDRTRSPKAGHPFQPASNVRVDRVFSTVWFGKEKRGSAYEYRFVLVMVAQFGPSRGCELVCEMGA